MESIFDSVSRGFMDSKDHGRYDGIDYANTFMANRKIDLIGVSFFGPKSEDLGIYNIFLAVHVSKKVNHSIPQCNDVLLKKTKITVSAMKNEKFFVAFPVPVTIPEDRWIDISFEIESNRDKPACFGQLRKKDMNQMTHLSKQGAVEFRFLRGSRQMSDLHFTLP